MRHNAGHFGKLNNQDYLYLQRIYSDLIYYIKGTKRRNLKSEDPFKRSRPDIEINKQYNAQVLRGGNKIHRSKMVIFKNPREIFLFGRLLLSKHEKRQFRSRATMSWLAGGSLRSRKLEKKIRVRLDVVATALTERIYEHLSATIKSRHFADRNI